MKILLDLNIKDRITMIMVTHDVGLKNFANRIVKMMDGKIANIEEINNENRLFSIETLNKIISILKEKYYSLAIFRK